jgi:hypothetical protein
MRLGLVDLSVPAQHPIEVAPAAAAFLRGRAIVNCRRSFLLSFFDVDTTPSLTVAQISSALCAIARWLPPSRPSEYLSLVLTPNTATSRRTNFCLPAGICRARKGLPERTIDNHRLREIQLFVWIHVDIVEELRRGWATLQRLDER